MTWAVRLSAAFLLAVIVLLMLPGFGEGYALAWEFHSSKDRITDEGIGFSYDRKSNGAIISFQCKLNRTIEHFIARVQTTQSDFPIENQDKVAWRIDDQRAQTGYWFSGSSRVGGTYTTGESAIKFALAASRARQRIVFRNSNGTVEFDARGSTKAITRLLEYCGIKR